MAITNFIPELWAAATLERWVQESVFAALVDRKYEGVARKGNSVHITGVVPPTVKDYKAAGRVTTADAISDTGVDLLIDQEKSVDFYVDDIDEVQAAGSLVDYTNAAADALIIDADEFIANMIVADGNVMPYSSLSTGDAAFDAIADARKLLNLQNAPAANRVVVCNAAFERLLLDSDSKLTAADKSGDNNGLRNATVGKVLDFRVITSNALPETDSPQFAAFHPSAVAYVSQIDKVEALRAEQRFADRVRMLHVYGGKVVRPEGVVVFNELGT